MRIGVVGTGFWARHCHIAGCLGSPAVELAAVWGRDSDRVDEAVRAAGPGVKGHTDFEAFLGDIDAVSFAVPPHVQVPLALRAMREGKHVLLEKPIALDAPAAAELADVAKASDVAAIVFFTNRYLRDVEGWISDAACEDWTAGTGEWISAALDEASPFSGSAWRREQGALWDVGPHVLSILIPILGEVESVRAVSGRGDLVHLVLAMEAGRTATCSLTLSAPPEAARTSFELWGEPGRATFPAESFEPVAAHTAAVGELAAMAASGERAHRCSVAFGRDVVDVLAEAQTQLDAAG